MTEDLSRAERTEDLTAAEGPRISAGRRDRGSHRGGAYRGPQPGGGTEDLSRAERTEISAGRSVPRSQPGAAILAMSESSKNWSGLAVAASGAPEIWSRLATACGLTRGVLLPVQIGTIA